MNMNIAKLIFEKMNEKVEETVKEEKYTKAEAFQVGRHYMEGYLGALVDLGYINFLEDKVCQCEIMKALHIRLDSKGENTELYQGLNEWEDIFFTLLDQWKVIHKAKESSLN